MARWVLVVTLVFGCAPQPQPQSTGPQTFEEMEARTREQAAREQAERDQADRDRAKAALRPRTNWTDLPSQTTQPEESTPALAYPPPTEAGCSKGCRCGETCIDCSDTCHKGAYSPPALGPNCKKGCPCGNACISCSKRCRK
jgi:hypothetical protein